MRVILITRITVNKYNVFDFLWCGFQVSNGRRKIVSFQVKRGREVEFEDASLSLICVILTLLPS